MAAHLQPAVLIIISLKTRITTNKRDIGIELARVIAIGCVIGVHAGYEGYVNGAVDKSLLLYDRFVADGVGVFWLIYGFLAYRSKSFSFAKTIKNLVKQIPISLFAFCSFVLFFGDFIVAGGDVISRHTH